MRAHDVRYEHPFSALRRLSNIGQAETPLSGG
jgi:hypothetical protein